MTMIDNATPWSLSNVAPNDWVSILKLELSSQGKQPSNPNCCHWLRQREVAARPTDISKLLAIRSSDIRLSPKLFEIISAIIGGVSARSMIKYFEDLFFRSFKFFLPFGGLQSIHEGKVPSGLYEAIRFSFSQPGKVAKSAFLFYRNKIEDEIVAGYANPVEPHTKQRKSSLVRFKELQIVENVAGGGFQVLIGGFVFYCRDSFYLMGAAFETDLDVNEEELRPNDIREVRPIWYILDDDNDIEIVRGIKPTSLRNEGDPAAAVVEMRRLGDYHADDWMNLSVRCPIDVGIFEAEELPNSHKRLRPTISQEYSMLSVNRLP